MGALDPPISKIEMDRNSPALSREPMPLMPYDPKEAVSTQVAAKIAMKSEATVRAWCATYAIGRRVAGGNWQVSLIALAAMLDNNEQALTAYLMGHREGSVSLYISALNGETYHPIVCHEEVRKHREQAKR